MSRSPRSTPWTHRRTVRRTASAAGVLALTAAFVGLGVPAAHAETVPPPQPPVCQEAPGGGLIWSTPDGGRCPVLPGGGLIWAGQDGARP